MTQPFSRMMIVATALAALAVAACSQQSGTPAAATAQPVEKTFTLTPSNAVMKVDFLTGQLQDLTITERVDPKSGTVVDAPELRGTLRLKNVSTDQSAQLIGGKLVFLDAKGQPIPIAKNRGDTSFTFSSFETQRLDPGQETSQSIDVPFPRGGLKADDLQTVRLDLTYLPSAYREQTVNYTVALKGQG